MIRSMSYNRNLSIPNPMLTGSAKTPNKERTLTTFPKPGRIPDPSRRDPGRDEEARPAQQPFQLQAALAGGAPEAEHLPDEPGQPAHTDCGKEDRLYRTPPRVRPARIVQAGESAAGVDVDMMADDRAERDGERPAQPQRAQSEVRPYHRLPPGRRDPPVREQQQGQPGEDDGRSPRGDQKYGHPTQRQPPAIQTVVEVGGGG